MKRKLDPESDRRGGQDVTTRQNAESTERKRRRGMVEKRRRDRMNSLYMELMQLVPSVKRKMVTTKVEKAELLEMTVEYVRNSLPLSPKMLTGTDSTEGTDTQLASRYYEAGHRDCSTKFSKYIISGVEGLGTNENSIRQNLVAFIDKNVADASQNGKDQRISSANSASLETKQNDRFSSLTTCREVLPTICYPSTQAYLTDSISFTRWIPTQP